MKRLTKKTAAKKTARKIAGRSVIPPANARRKTPAPDRLLSTEGQGKKWEAAIGAY